MNGSLGENIRCLRLAYGETQEELGASIGVEKTTVSNYEKGHREPDRITIDLIAKHFMISTDELTNSDFTEIPKIDVDHELIWKKMKYILPIQKPSHVPNNKKFTEAYKKHVLLYNRFKELNLDIDLMIECMDAYSDAYEDEEVKIISAANLVGLLLLFIFFFKGVSVVMSNNTAALKQVVKKNPKMQRDLSEMDSDYEKDFKEVFDELNNEEIDDQILEYMLLLKKSQEYSDLADYYLSLQYFWNLKNNNLQFEFNRRIGLEMLTSFLDLDNKYVAGFWLAQTGKI